MRTPPRVIAVVGPTAAGKSALALELAERLGAEIVNADSMQLYAGMDIGTAKASTAERARVPHHLLDVWSPAREASVADYQQLARTTITELLAAGTSVVLVGGSGLYVRAVLDELEFPGVDLELRAALYDEVDRVGPEVLHARLEHSDPAAALAIPPTNARRIIRALEVIAVTGRAYSAALPTYGPLRFGALQLGVDVPTPELDRRIALRIDAMWDRGLLAEAVALRDGPGLGTTAVRALGYAQALAHDRGDPADEGMARAATAQATRRYARRQRSWFRRDPRISWLVPVVADDAAVEVRAAATARLALELLGSRGAQGTGVMLGTAAPTGRLSTLG